jgi:hypothetical protein
MVCFFHDQGSKKSFFLFVLRYQVVSPSADPSSLGSGFLLSGYPQTIPQMILQPLTHTLNDDELVGTFEEV